MTRNPSELQDAGERKRAAACAAVTEVQDGMLVGLGSGTTAAYAIAALGERVAEGLNIRTVATSLAACRAAKEAGLTVLPFDAFVSVDLAIDGADELDPRLRAIKGKGGAMLREKVVASAAARMIAILDAGKQVTSLGRSPLPVEVLPFAAGFVADRIGQLGATVCRRMIGNSSFRTDQRNIILDCRFGAIADPQALAAALSAIPGIMGHGLFVDEIDAAYVGGSDGVIQLTSEAS